MPSAIRGGVVHRQDRLATRLAATTTSRVGLARCSGAVEGRSRHRLQVVSVHGPTSLSPEPEGTWATDRDRRARRHSQGRDQSPLPSGNGRSRGASGGDGAVGEANSSGPEGVDHPSPRQGQVDRVLVRKIGYDAPPGTDTTDAARPGAVGHLRRFPPRFRVCHQRLHRKSTFLSHQGYRRVGPRGVEVGVSATTLRARHRRRWKMEEGPALSSNEGRGRHRCHEASLLL